MLEHFKEMANEGLRILSAANRQDLHHQIPRGGDLKAFPLGNRIGSSEKYHESEGGHQCPESLLWSVINAI